ncbi:photosystem reaction center subunit H [Methylobacterium sp. JK268]
MLTRAILLSAALAAAPGFAVSTVATSASAAETPPAGCPALALPLDDEIARVPALREPANEQTVRDLRTLRDAAIVLDAYKYGPECDRLSAILKDLLANPRKTIGQGGDTDEDKAEAVEETRTGKRK